MLPRIIGGSDLVVHDNKPRQDIEAWLREATEVKDSYFGMCAMIDTSKSAVVMLVLLNITPNFCHNIIILSFKNKIISQWRYRPEACRLLLCAGRFIA